MRSDGEILKNLSNEELEELKKDDKGAKELTLDEYKRLEKVRKSKRKLELFKIRHGLVGRK